MLVAFLLSFNNKVYCFLCIILFVFISVNISQYSVSTLLSSSDHLACSTEQVVLWKTDSLYCVQVRNITVVEIFFAGGVKKSGCDTFGVGVILQMLSKLFIGYIIHRILAMEATFQKVLRACNIAAKNRKMSWSFRHSKCHRDS